MEPAANQGYTAQTSDGFFISLKRYLPFILGVIVIANLIIINGFVFFNRKASEKSQLATIAPTLTPFPIQGSTAVQNGDITTQINQATDSVKLQILNILSITPLPTQILAPSSTPTPQASSQTTHEYFVPLGTGFGNGTDWTTITQLGVTVNPANYGTIKSVVFEASVRIPTGNQTVYVRLLNADTYQYVVGSDLTLSGGTPTILTSQSISLASGSHLYQLQLKTQLGYLTYIDFARLRITVNN